MINVLHRVIRGAVRVLAVLMVVTILWGVGDVIYVLYSRLFMPAITEFAVHDIIVTFGAFLAARDHQRRRYRLTDLLWTCLWFSRLH